MDNKKPLARTQPYNLKNQDLRELFVVFVIAIIDSF